MIPLGQLVDIAADHNIAPTEYISQFDIYGAWQLDALLSIGLKPDSNLLDIGCGAMRLGVVAVPYLTNGFYAGIDAFPTWIEIGAKIAQSIELPNRYSLYLDNKFDFGYFNRNFDFAIAQSVFTHLSRTGIRECIQNTTTVMKPGGKFLFTYSPGTPRTQGFLYSGLHPMMRPSIDDKGLAEIGAEFGLKLETPDLQHPSQSVRLFAYHERSANP